MLYSGITRIIASANAVTYFLSPEDLYVRKVPLLEPISLCLEFTMSVRGINGDFTSTFNFSWALFSKELVMGSVFAESFTGPELLSIDVIIRCSDI